MISCKKILLSQKIFREKSEEITLVIKNKKGDNSDYNKQELM
jgi:hypothetical protein